MNICGSCGEEDIKMWHPFKKNAVIGIDTFFTMFKVHYDEDFRFNGEVHDFWECLYVIDGSCQASANENVYELKEGDIIFHKPMELHKFNVTDQNGATLFIFSFNLSGRSKRYFENKVFSLNWEQRKILDNLISYMEKAVKCASVSLLEFPYHAFLMPSKFSDIYMEKVTYQIYLFFLSLIDSDEKAQPVSNLETELFKKAVTFMKENTNQNLSIEEVARHCNTSLSGIKRLFSKYSGMGVHKYFLDLKLKKAITLLESGMSVQEVTDALSFSSQSYFSSAFKREIGKNPSDFK